MGTMTDAKVAAAGKEKMLTLRSSDGHEFEVSEAVAMESQTIKNMIDEGCADNGIPLPNVSSEILSKVIVFCKKHVEASAADAVDGEASSEPKKTAVDDLKTFDSDFVNVDQATLFDLMMAANYLDIKALLDLTCQTVADMMKGKTPDQIRATFNIENDYTADEEEQVRRENQWAFE